MGTGDRWRRHAEAVERPARRARYLRREAAQVDLGWRAPGRAAECSAAPRAWWGIRAAEKAARVANRSRRFGARAVAVWPDPVAKRQKLARLSVPTNLSKRT